MIPEQYTSEAKARSVTEAEWRRIQHSQAMLNLTLAASTIARKVHDAVGI